jgi:antitoxin component of RelBE/YafQ-DinJ toxin-antitoxin module
MSKRAVFSVRIPAEIKAEWEAYCRSKNQSPSHAIRIVIRHLLKHGGEKTPVRVSAHDPDESRSRLELRLSKSEFASIERIAEQAGTSANKWIADLARSYITHEPQFGMHELQAVGESNNQLRAIGRNLNQIALALNRGGQGGDALGLIVKLTSDINEHTEKVNSVIRSNLDRWRVTWR